ncbi:MAG: class I SAM-dependent methyltransferase [Prochlorococcaceae cyanobacterium]
MSDYVDYGWAFSGPDHTDAYLLEPIAALLPPLPADRPGRALDLGCGNGWLSGWLAARGWQVVGVDPSATGIERARAGHPAVRFEVLFAGPDLLEHLGVEPFDLVVSTEVVEHLYAPRAWAAAAHGALRPGGTLVCSTPYHGYLKNLALAVSGQLDAHFTALWDGGHIKFWSRASLSRLLTEAGFDLLEFRGAGRLPWLWKSMVMAGRKAPSSIIRP